MPILLLIDIMDIQYLKNARASISKRQEIELFTREVLTRVAFWWRIKSFQLNNRNTAFDNSIQDERVNWASGCHVSELFKLVIGFKRLIEMRSESSTRSEGSVFGPSNQLPVNSRRKLRMASPMKSHFRLCQSSVQEMLDR